jgi:hypothetical protein
MPATEALKIRFVYTAEDGVTDLACSEPSLITHRGETQHRTTVEVALLPGGECQATGGAGATPKRFKYEKLLEKHPDRTGVRRIHVRLRNPTEKESPPIDGGLPPAAP